MSYFPNANISQSGLSESQLNLQQYMAQAQQPYNQQQQNYHYTSQPQQNQQQPIQSYMYDNPAKKSIYVEVISLRQQVEEMKQLLIEKNHKIEQLEKDNYEKDKEIVKLQNDISNLMPLEADEDDNIFKTIQPQQIQQKEEIKKTSSKKQKNISPKNVPLPIKPQFPPQIKGTDESKFTFKNVTENLAQWGGKMYIASAEIAESKIKPIYKMKQSNLTDLDLSKILNEHPTAVILLRTKKLVFAIKGSKKFSDKSSNGLLKDPEFEVYILMFDNKYQKGWKLKPKEQYGFDFSDKDTPIVLINLFDISKQARMGCEMKYMTKKSLEEYFEIVGNFEKLIDRPNEQVLDLEIIVCENNYRCTKKPIFRTKR